MVLYFLGGENVLIIIIKRNDMIMRKYEDALFRRTYHVRFLPRIVVNNIKLKCKTQK